MTGNQEAMQADHRPDPTAMRRWLSEHQHLKDTYAYERVQNRVARYGTPQSAAAAPGNREEF